MPTSEYYQCEFQKYCSTKKRCPPLKSMWTSTVVQRNDAHLWILSKFKAKGHQEKGSRFFINILQKINVEVLAGPPIIPPLHLAQLFSIQREYIFEYVYREMFWEEKNIFLKSRFPADDPSCRRLMLINERRKFVYHAGHLVKIEFYTRPDFD